MISPSRVAYEPGTPDIKTDPADLKCAQTFEKGHGRIETRMISVRTEFPSWVKDKWRDTSAICRIERRRKTKTYCSFEVVYAGQLHEKNR
jgi:hypothetical protein